MRAAAPTATFRRGRDWAPVGKMLARSDLQQRTPVPQNLAAFGQDLVGLAKRLAAASCSTIARTHVDGRAQRGDGGQRAALGADPADPQAAPERFRHRPDRQHQIAPRVIAAAIGAGTGSSSHMSVIVSSMMVRVRVSAMMCAEALVGPPAAASCPSGCGCRESGRPGSATADAPRRRWRRVPSRHRSSRPEPVELLVVVMADSAPW